MLILLLAALMLASPAAAAEHSHGGTEDLRHLHEVPVIPNKQNEFKDRLQYGFRDKNADLSKKNGYFLDQAGNKVRLSGYRGKLVLMDFIYSDCKHGICQYLNKKMNFVAGKHKDRLGKELVLVSLSFDEQDTPTSLAAFAANWEKDPAKWAYLSGLPGDISETCKEYGIAFRWNEQEGFFEHTVRTILIGRDGKVLKTYRGRDYKMQEVVDDITNLLAGKPVSAPQ